MFQKKLRAGAAIAPARTRGGIMENLIDIKGVTHAYKTESGPLPVLDGLDVAVPEGTFAAVVGPSGCGKSTLLRMVAGLETITAGDIELAGRRVNDLEPAERNIAMVFQNYALYPHMSVRNNLAYGLKNRGTPKKEIDQKVTEAAELLQNAQFLARRPSQ